MKNLIAVLHTGCKLVFLRRPEIKEISFTPELFWLLTIINIVIHFVESYLTSEPPKKFDVYGFQSLGFSIFLTLLAAFTLSKLLRLSHTLWILASLLCSAGIFLYVIDSLMYGVALAENDSWQQAYYYFSIYWWFLILFTILSTLIPFRSHFVRITSTLPILAISVAPTFFIFQNTLWTTDYYSQYMESKAEEDEPINAERILFEQPDMLTSAFSEIEESTQGKTNLYFLAFGSYGRQDVFRKEVEFVDQLFAKHFGTERRSISLVNHPETIDQIPLASSTNLEKTLEALAKKMDREEDILFVYLTSHGSQDHELSIKLRGLPLNDLPAEELARMLNTINVKWKVIVISACYSGGFIEHLKNDHTLVITAAHKDKQSFGCSDNSDLTYFAKAYFRDALIQTETFTDAYYKAVELVTQWETSENQIPSEPQISTSPLIEGKLKEWRANLSERHRDLDNPKLFTTM